MITYHRIDRLQLGAGDSAIVLFLREDALSASVLERGYDGRLREREPLAPGAAGIILAIGACLHAHPAATTLAIVLEPGAYWPDVFPPLVDSKYAVQDRSSELVMLS